MRTEQQLREAFATLAERPHPSDAVLMRILTRTSPTMVRGRRTLLVLAAVAVVVLALTLPNLVVNRSAVPADTRAPGNWNLIHRVDLPSGWEISGQQVAPRSETTSVRPIGAEPGTESCSIDIAARGRYQPVASAEQREPVEIGGHPGFYVAPTHDLSVTTGVFWSYADDAWANVECTRNGASLGAESVDMARRVTFAPTLLLVPFRLRSLPKGYVGSYVAQGRVEDTDALSVGVALDPTVRDGNRPQIGIVVAPGSAQVVPGVPGYETGTVRGFPAVFYARDSILTLNVGDRSVRIAAEGGTPADLSRSLWPAGRRELLLDVADRLKLADFGDPATWFDANRAFGS